MAATEKSTETLAEGAFPAEAYGYVGLKRGSPECEALEERYPGIRFNRVEVSVFPLFRFENSPDEDYIEVNFNLSGSQETLARHGFGDPEFSVVRVKAGGRVRLTSASYADGLDRLAALFTPPLLARFQRTVRS